MYRILINSIKLFNNIIFLSTSTVFVIQGYLKYFYSLHILLELFELWNYIAIDNVRLYDFIFCAFRICCRASIIIYPPIGSIYYSLSITKR